jgi:type I restriction-modification system DNA methylase subunit
MVVPEGTLFRSGAFADVKRDLLEPFDLHTIVSLPPGTFAPYSDVKTALLFFDRPGPTREIWYYVLWVTAAARGQEVQQRESHPGRALRWSAVAVADLACLSPRE